MRATDGTGQAGFTAPRHCWVTLSSGRYPGVLVEWKQDGAAWKGYVFWADQHGAHTGWLDAKQLTPLDS